MTQPDVACEPSLALPQGGYVRTFEAAADYLLDETVRVRGTLSDHRCTLEYDWVVQIPECKILQASARHLSGEPVVLSPQLRDRSSDILGVCTSQGFTKTIRQTLGHLPGHQEHLALAIEMARVSLQAYPVPKEDHKRFEASVVALPPGPHRLARMVWERDRADWPWLRNSCHTYRDESASLFDEHTAVGFDLDNISPEPGQKRFFWRRKCMKISTHQNPLRFQCQNDMADSYQEMRVAFDIEPDGTLNNATSQGVRLPFQGLCEAPHRRTGGLNGLTLSKKFARLLADQVGGSTGCSHLFDLATDCVRFFNWRD